MTKHERGTKSPITLRRVLPIAAVIFVLAVLCVAPVGAADSVSAVEIKATYDWYTSVTNGDTYTITTVDNLTGLAMLTQGKAVVNGQNVAKDDFEGKTVILGNNLVFDENQYWYYSDGTNTYDYRIDTFAGTFDGNDKTITGLKFYNSVTTTNPYMYLFNVIDDTVQDLTLDTVTADINGYDYFGFLAYTLNGKATNCHVKNVKVTVSVASNGNGYIASSGAMFGKIASATVTGCTSDTVSVTCYGNDNTDSVGGLIGSATGTADARSTIEKCSVKAITFDCERKTKRLAGFIGYTNYADVTDCTATDVTIEVDNYYQSIGGFVGNPTNDSTFKNCKVEGFTLEGKTTQYAGNVGGFAGYTYSNIDNPITFTGCSVSGLDMNLECNDNNEWVAGGFLGYPTSNVAVDDCSVSGDITVTGSGADHAVGGFIGTTDRTSNNDITVDGSAANVNIDTIGTAGGFVGNANGEVTLTITDSTANGKVSSSNGVAGGFVGTGNNGNFNNCASTGTVSGAIEGNTHSVTLNANDGISEPEILSVTHGNSITLDNPFTRAGYTFIGWNKTADGTAISYTDKQSVVVTDALNLYALWKINTPEPFTVSTDKDMITAGETATLTASVPANGAPGVTYLYQWYSVTDNVALDGKTTATITVSPEKRTVYNCTITAKQGDDVSETGKSSNTITINVWKQDTTDISADEEEAFEEAIEGDFKELFEEVDGLILVNITLLDENGQPDHVTQIIFTVDYQSDATGITADNYNQYKFVVLHYNALTGKVEHVPDANVNPTENGLVIESAVSPFVIGYSLQTSGGGGGGNGGSSYTQGSSVWLTESQTPTETPSEQPTDVAPTNVPTTQPTATETETPGFGVLAVLAGLGAVAVLRRK